MDSITRKGDIKSLVEACLSEPDTASKAVHFHENILLKKVRFPLLEYASELLFEAIPDNDQPLFLDEIERYHTEGGNVILGYLLMLRLKEHFSESIVKATTYIANGDDWYVPDIIGERVLGRALLFHFDPTLKILYKLSTHESNWVVRSIGAGAHYAIKKGLPEAQTEKIFQLLLSLADAKDHHIKRGIGWAAKTTAKFHPQVIALYKDQLEHNTIGKWFKTKVNIGLERHKYAATNRG